MKKPRTITGRIYCPSAEGVDKRHLARGIKVEMEHTGSKRVARCIALGHIALKKNGGEGKVNYYPRLERAGL